MSTNTGSTSLSERALDSFQEWTEFYQNMALAKTNVYHKESNPQGIINMALAENRFCTDLMMEQMSKIAAIPEDDSVLHYDVTIGREDFRKALATFLTHEFRLEEMIDYRNIVATNGVTTILENVAFTLADIGDYIMIPCPLYYRIAIDFRDRAKVRTLPVPLKYVTRDGKASYELDIPAMEKAYQLAVKEGKTVKAIMIVNPNNPTGDVFSAESLSELLQFAHRHNLHVVSNELYALSVFDPEVRFSSILSVPHPDPSRVHVIYGFSKDFGLSGYRSGCFITRDPQVFSFMSLTAIYTRSSGVIQHRLRHFMGDLDWIDNTYLPTLKSRMAERFGQVRKELELRGAKVHHGPATVFQWVNLAPFLDEPSFAAEHRLCQRLLEAGVFLIPGKEFTCEEPGWFRILCGLEEELHQEGMKRLISILEENRPKSS